MSYSVADPNYTVLPQALLETARQHMRVTFFDDDDQILKCLKWAISYVENFTDLRIFPTDVAWLPEATTESRLQCPVQPVSSFTATVDSLPVSMQYRLERTSTAMPVWFARIDGTAIADGINIALIGGYADAAKLPPALEGNILRITATLYENRESITSFSLDQIPFWLNDMLTNLWVPRA